jgi:hypothetical protein
VTAIGQPPTANHRESTSKPLPQGPRRVCAEGIGRGSLLAGAVVDTDPLVIELSEHGQTHRLTVLDSDTEVEIGQRLSVFGTLQSEDTIMAKDSYLRDPANAQYMYVVSFLAGLWVLARLLNGWQLNTTELTVEPRETSLLSQFN